MLNSESVGKFFVFRDGPFKGLIFKVLAYDDKALISNIRFAQYGRVENVSNELARSWGWFER